MDSSGSEWIRVNQKKKKDAHGGVGRWRPLDAMNKNVEVEVKVEQN